MGVGIRDWGMGNRESGSGSGSGSGLESGADSGQPKADSREWGMGSRRQAAGCHLVNFRENKCIKKGL